MPQNKITVIVGPKGSGKSHRAAKLFSGESRAVLFNVADDKQFLPFCTEIIDDYDHLPDVSEIRHLLEERWRKGEEVRISYHSSLMVPGSRGQAIYPALNPLLKTSYECGNLTLYLDEAHQLCSPWTMPFQMYRMVRLGRHRSLSMVFITQRFSGVHREITHNADEIHFFKTREPIEIEEIKKRCGAKTANRVQNLKRLELDSKGRVERPGECLVWTLAD